MPNNFANDSNCKALWRLENGALTTDSKGTNTLTNNGVTADTSNFKEGLASGSFVLASSQYQIILDSNLNSGFPLKNGDSNKNISVSAWVRPSSFGAEGINRLIFAKWDSTNNRRSFGGAIITSGSNYYARIFLGYNSGASGEGWNHGTTLSVNNWYHITFTYQDSDKSYAIRIRDVNGIIGTDLTGTATLDSNKLAVGVSPFTLGALMNDVTPNLLFDGPIDELVVFDDILTAAEATQIALGIYGLPIPNFKSGNLNKDILNSYVLSKRILTT